MGNYTLENSDGQSYTFTLMCTVDDRITKPLTSYAIPSASYTSAIILQIMGMEREIKIEARIPCADKATLLGYFKPGLDVYYTLKGNEYGAGGIDGTIKDMAFTNTWDDPNKTNVTITFVVGDVVTDT